jgi:Replication-relaxation
MSDPVLRIQSQLTDRDFTLLGWLADHGVLTTFQIAKALFPSLDYAQNRLLALRRLRLLDRFRPHKPDGGSHPYHYVLDQLGVEVVAAQRGENLPRKDAARKCREHLTHRANLPHRLGTNQFFIDLAAHARTHPGAALREWWPESKCRDIAAFARPGDDLVLYAVRRSWVRPDGYAVWAEDDRTVHAFVEFDLGTEDLPTLVGKVDAYRELFVRLRRTWPVLFWLHSSERERNLHRLLADREGWSLMATGARDHADGAALDPAEEVWSRVNGDGVRDRLIDLDILQRGLRQP